MKTIKLFSAILFCCSLSAAAVAQSVKTETFHVSGNCGMCETKIEKAAKSAGASYAEWNKDTKVITVKYDSKSTDAARIQQGIAGAGYDNVGARATDDAYNKLHSCCKYDRTAASATETPECCKDGKCTKEGHDGKDCCKKEGNMAMDCCKDGKCTMPGHSGKDCCKKS
jgi:periplasmic mercuric ion binding protein